MARLSTVCTHPKRLEIEAALRHGVSLRQISKTFAVSRAAAHRHKIEMRASPISVVPMIDVQVIADVQQEASPFRQIDGLKEAALSELNAARRRGDQPAAVAWMRETRALLELRSKLSEQSPEEGTSADIKREMARRLRMLKAYGDLHGRLVNALRQQALEAGDGDVIDLEPSTGDPSEPE